MPCVLSTMFNWPRPFCLHNLLLWVLPTDLKLAKWIPASSISCTLLKELNRSLGGCWSHSTVCYTGSRLSFPQYLPAFAVLHVWIGSCLQEGLCNLCHLCHDIWWVLLGAVRCHKVQRSLLISQGSSIHTGTIFNEKVCSKFISFCETKQGY